MKNCLYYWKDNIITKDKYNDQIYLCKNAKISLFFINKNTEASDLQKITKLSWYHAYQDEHTIYYFVNSPHLRFDFVL